MKRILALIPFLGLLPAAALAQKATLFGTKPDLVVATPTTSAPLVDGWALVQMVLALGLVLVLIKFGLPWAMKFFKAPVQAETSGDLKLKTTIACGNSNLQIVEVRGKEILVAVHSSGITYLTDVPAATQDDQPAFFEMLDAKKMATESKPKEEDLGSIKNPTVAALQKGADAAKKRPKLSVGHAVVEDRRPTAPAEPEDKDFAESLRILREARMKMESRQTGAKLSG